MNDLIQQAKVWRRTVVARAQRAKKLGKKVPDALLATANVTGVPNIAAQVEKMLKLVEANVDNLPGTSLKPILTEGQTLVDGIKDIDAEQEIRKPKSLPEAVRTFYYHKGLLFTGIKVVNDAVRELHSHDPSAASKYTLSILYRNTHKKKSGSKGAAAK